MGFKVKPTLPIIMLSIFLLFAADATQAVNQDFCGYIGTLYKYGIGAIGILAAMGIAIAGVIWVTAAGSDSKIKEAKSWIGSSLLGLTLALTAFLILGTINPALTTCNTYSLSAIGSLGTNYSTDAKDTSQKLVYPKQGGYKGKICNPPGDGSGVIWCCVISGTLVGASDFRDPTVNRCCSPEIKDRAAAEKECVRFYNNYNEERILKEFKSATNVWGNLSGDPKAYDYYKKNVQLKKPPTLNGDDENFATVYAKPCWENPNVDKWCVPRVDPQFCSFDSADEGDACEVSDGVWGYCKNKKCWKCKTWGEDCTEDYQCPDQTNKLSGKCGNEIFKAMSPFSSDCDSGKCDYEGN